MEKPVNNKAFLSKPSVVKRCTCRHQYQDERHGEGMRVHNPCAKGYRCTVCESVRE